MWILIVSYLVKYMTMSVRTIAASLSQVSSSLEEAADPLNDGSEKVYQRSITLLLNQPETATRCPGWWPRGF